MWNNKFREQAIELRRRGKTYPEVQKALGVKIPKSTLSYWCSTIEPPPEYKKRVERMWRESSSRGRKMAVASNRAKRREYLKTLAEKNRHLRAKLVDKDVSKLALATLYLGEGAKWKSTRGLALGNSDPDIVKIYIQLLEQCYGINRNDLKARITYRADQDIEKLIEYWSNISGIPRNNFYETKPDPRTKGSRTRKKDYMGVCTVIGGGTEIQLELDIIARMFLH